MSSPQMLRATVPLQPVGQAQWSLGSAGSRLRPQAPSVKPAVLQKRGVTDPEPSRTVPGQTSVDWLESNHEDENSPIHSHRGSGSPTC